MQVYAQTKRLVQAGQDFFAHQPGMGLRFGRGFAQAFQHHHKFITAQPGDRVLLPHTGGQALGHALQKAVARVVPQRVVQSFEVIQIQKENGTMLSTAAACCQCARQPVAQQPAVGQVGEGIKKGQLLNLSRCRAQCRYVFVHDHCTPIGRAPLRDVNGSSGRQLAIDCALHALPRQSLGNPFPAFLVACLWHVLAGRLLQNRAKRQAYGEHGFCPRKQADVTRVPGDDFVRRIEQHQTAGHGSQGLVEVVFGLRHGLAGLRDTGDIPKRQRAHDQGHQPECQGDDYDQIASVAPFLQGVSQRDAGGDK